jgi:hypothetical protein
MLTHAYPISELVPRARLKGLLGLMDGFQFSL